MVEGVDDSQRKCQLFEYFQDDRYIHEIISLYQYASRRLVSRMRAITLSILLFVRFRTDLFEIQKFNFNFGRRSRIKSIQSS